jgi:hypothetical protein
MTRVVRQRRFTDERSEIVWAAIETLDVGLQYALLRELATDFAAEISGNRSMKQRVRRAVLALHDAADVLGHSPSVGEYRQLRVALPELDLPPDPSIRSWLGGGWNDCLRRSLLPAVADGDFASKEVGLTYRLKDEEIFAALRECNEEFGHPPTASEYMQWARRPDVIARPGRRFRSYRPLERLGGFREALVKAGVIQADEARFGADGRLLPTSYAYDEAEMKTALLLVADRLGKAPQAGEYQRERDAIRTELAVNEKTYAPQQPRPSSSTSAHGNTLYMPLASRLSPPMQHGLRGSDGPATPLKT